VFPIQDMTSFEFAGHVLDLRQGRLQRRGVDVPLRCKSFSLLAYLVRNAGRVLGKDELVTVIWPRVTVSDDSLAQCIKDIRKALGPDAGDLIRTVPRRGYVVNQDLVRTLGNEPVAHPRSNTPSQSDKPSIAILPFSDLSDDKGQHHFIDGLGQEIITALSEFKWLDVVAHNSGPAYWRHDEDVKAGARERDVRYRLEGSVRRVADQVRISVQLVDAMAGATLWAGRFDGELSSVFELQDKLSESVVGSIAPKLEQAEIVRARHKQTASLDAYDHYLRGIGRVHEWTKEANSEALSHFERAIELDPNFASAYGMAARCYVQRKSGGWVTDHAEAADRAEWLARRAIALGRDDAVALATAGFALAEVVGGLNDGAAFIDRALVLNPNLAWAWLFSGWVRIYLGEPDAAIERLAHAMSLSPQDPQLFCMHGAIACAHIVAGRFAEAMQSARTPLREHPDFLMSNCIATTSAALAGRLDEAQSTMVRLRQIDPGLRIANVNYVIGAFRPEGFTNFADGLRMAGLPD
jgi:TolB-like protein/tetratricopeptide (TPR) repeat protein